jgi:hypothetical protein
LRSIPFAWPAVVAAALALSLNAVPAAAKGGPSNKVKVQTPKVQTPKAQAPKARPAMGATSARPVKSTGVKPATAGGPKAKPQTAPRGNAGMAKTKPAGSPAVAKGSAPLPPSTVPLNKAQQKLLQNPKMREKLQARVPVDVDVVTAAAGFKNFGQFVAAINVSNNRGLDFKGLRDLMTGENPLSLGQAIQQLSGVDDATASRTASAALADADLEVQATTAPAKKSGKR